MRRAIVSFQLLALLVAARLTAQRDYVEFYTPPPPTVQTATARQTAGTAGSTTYYYWVVARYPAGNAVPDHPATVERAGTVGGANSITVNWNPLAGATGYDVLRRTLPWLPAAGGACNCRVALGVAGPPVVDNVAAPVAYTIAAASEARANLRLDNRDATTPTLRGSVSTVLPSLEAAGNITGQLRDRGGNFFSSAAYVFAVSSGRGVAGDLSAAGTNKTVAFTACPEGVQPDERQIKSVSAQGTVAVLTTTGAGVTPISVDTAAPHGRSTGDVVVITGVTGNYAANGAWVITVVDADTFTLDNSLGSAAYVAGGTVYQEPLLTTTIAHGLADRQRITVSYTTGAPSINGVWPVRTVNATQFYLRGAPATGAYTTGYVSKDSYHWVYLSGGVGTAEAVLLRGGTCLTAGSTGTLRFDTTNAHTDGWSVASATAGIRETLQACPTMGCEIRLPAGVLTTRAPLYIGDGDLYSPLAHNALYYRAALSSRYRVRLIGWGKGSGDLEDAGTEIRYIGADSAGWTYAPVVLAGAEGSEIGHLKLTSCRIGGSCFALGLRLVGTDGAWIHDTTIIAARANSVGILLDGNVSQTVFDRVDAAAQNASGVGLAISLYGFLGQYGSGGASQNVFKRCSFLGEAGNVDVYIGAADNNTFIELITLQSGAGKGIRFRKPLLADGQTLPFYNTFPQENSFLNCPIIGGIAVDNAPLEGLDNFFFPYPVGDGEPVPSLAKISGITTDRQWFGTGFNFLGALAIGNGTLIAKHLSATASLNAAAPGAVPGCSADLAITVTGAALGDTATVAPPVTIPASFTLTGWVSAANTVSIRWCQLAGAAADPDGGGGTYRADVWQH